ncbi:MAG: N-acyl-D-amino-acid deacylase family protein [Candidatus Bathyarchaeia archaeon]
MSFDIILKAERVLDGTGNPWFKADIGIADGRIEAISHIPLREAKRVIDVEGHIICPGFINLHSHSDSTIHYHKNAENCLSMGLVTELVGQCGSSAAPIKESYKEKLRRRFLRRLSPTESINWTSLDEWLRKLEEAGIGVNIAPLIGHGTIRECVMGEEGEGGEEVHPSEAQMEEMCERVERGMEDGAFGLSTGLNYAPGRNAVTSEIIELNRIVSRYGGLYSSHMRDEGNYLLEALREFIKICEESDVKGIVSHHKASGRGNYGKPCETLRMIDKARDRGVDIIIDQYPWRHGGTIKSLGTRFRMWDVTEDNLFNSREKLLEELKSPEGWERLKQSYVDQIEKERKLYRERKGKIEEELGWTPKPYALQDGGTVLYSKSHPELNGKTFKEVVKIYKKEDELEALRSLLIEDDGWTCAGGTPYSEEM